MGRSCEPGSPLCRPWALWDRACFTKFLTASTQNATQVNSYFLCQDTVLGAEGHKTDRKPCPVELRT